MSIDQNAQLDTHTLIFQIKSQTKLEKRYHIKMLDKDWNKMLDKDWNKMLDKDWNKMLDRDWNKGSNK